MTSEAIGGGSPPSGGARTESAPRDTAWFLPGRLDPIWVGTVVCVLAVWLLAGHGLTAARESLELERVRGALGEPLRGITRSAELPHWWRVASTRALAPWLGLERAFRMPAAIALGVFAACAVGLSRHLSIRPASAATGQGAPTRDVWLRARAALVAVIAVGSSGAVTGVVGGGADAFAQASVAGALWAWLALLTAPPGHASRSTIRAILALAATAIATACCGLWLGAGLPTCVAVAIVGARDSQTPHLQHAPPSQSPSSRFEQRTPLDARRWILVATIGVAATIVAGITMLRVGDGWLGILAAARPSASLGASVSAPAWTNGIIAQLRLVHPWLALAIVGLALTRDRRLVAWCALVLAFIGPWHAQYGMAPALLPLPAAIACVGGLDALAKTPRGDVSRRAAMLAIVCGSLLVARDVAFDPLPYLAADPVAIWPVSRWPTHARHALEQPLGKGLAVVVLASFLAALLPSLRGLSRVAPAGLADARSGEATSTTAAGVLALATILTWTWTADALARATSPRAVMTAMTRAQAEGLPVRLGHSSHAGRLLAPYLRGHDIEHFARTAELEAWYTAHVASGRPVAALVGRRDFAVLYGALTRQGMRPTILDASHPELVALGHHVNAPFGAEDPLADILVDGPCPLAHAAEVTWEAQVRLEGWEVSVHAWPRRAVEVSLCLRVLAPPPGSLRVVARLERGRGSRSIDQPAVPTDDLYGLAAWRPGDLIVSTHRVDASRLLLGSGEHDLVLGLSRGEDSLLTIRAPTGAEDPHGIRIKGHARRWAILGAIELP